MKAVTEKEISYAIESKFASKGMPISDINKIAEFIFGLFSIADCVDDMKLSRDERDIMYMLEEEGLLKIVDMSDEPSMRKPFWVLNLKVPKHTIDFKADGEEECMVHLYTELPIEAWNKTNIHTLTL